MLAAEEAANRQAEQETDPVEANHVLLLFEQHREHMLAMLDLQSKLSNQKAFTYQIPALGNCCFLAYNDVWLNTPGDVRDDADELLALDLIHSQRDRFNDDWDAVAWALLQEGPWKDARTTRAG